MIANSPFLLSHSWIVDLLSSTSYPLFNFSTTPPLSVTRVSTIDSLLIQSHYFPKHGHTVWLPLNHSPA